MTSASTQRPLFLQGAALYGSAYLLPQYLAVTQGFDSEQAGEVMAWTGLPLLVIPLAPLLMKCNDARLLVGTGVLIFAASCFMNLDLNQDSAAPQLFWPNVIRALGQAIVMTPISAIAMVGIAPAEAGAASGLFNMMRNLGGAIGTAAVETFFTKREQFHSAIINEHVSLLEPATRNRLADLQQYFMSHGFPDPAGALHRAIIAVGQTIRAQATAWAMLTASRCLASSSSSPFFRLLCSERVPPPAARANNYGRSAAGSRASAHPEKALCRRPVQPSSRRPAAARSRRRTSDADWDQRRSSGRRPAPV